MRDPNFLGPFAVWVWSNIESGTHKPSHRLCVKETKTHPELAIEREQVLLVDEDRGPPLDLLPNSVPQVVGPTHQGTSRAPNANWTHTMNARMAT